MKKLLIFAGVLATSLSLAGCSGTNESAVINRLSHQLDRTANTVSTINQDASSDIAIENISKLFSNKASTSQISVLSEAYQSSANAASSARGLSNKINKKIINIKKSIAGNIKLGNDNTGTINELTTSMQKYTSNLNKTKSEYKNVANAIYKIGEDNESEQLDVKLAKLSCCVEARNCYMQNLLLTLENIENILNGIEESTQEENEDNQVQNSFENDLISQQTKDLPAQNSTQINQNYPFSNGYYPNQPYNQNTMYYGGANGYNNAYNNGYGYGYGSYGWRGGFNPDRNTDTYGPGATNIDTYKFNGNNRHFNGSNGINMIDDIAKEPSAEQDVMTEENEIDNDVNENVTISSVNEHINKSKSSFNPPIKKHRNMLGHENEKIVEENLKEDNGINFDESVDEVEDEEMKIRSVDADVEEFEEEIQGEHKVKGHTKTEADINKDIENLIKKPS